MSKPIWQPEDHKIPVTHLRTIDMLDEYLVLRATDPDESNGMTDQAYWTRLRDIRENLAVRLEGW